MTFLDVRRRKEEVDKFMYYPIIPRLDEALYWRFVYFPPEILAWNSALQYSSCDLQLQYTPLLRLSAPSYACVFPTPPSSLVLPFLWNPLGNCYKISIRWTTQLYFFLLLEYQLHLSASLGVTEWVPREGKPSQGWQRIGWCKDIRRFAGTGWALFDTRQGLLEITRRSLREALVPCSRYKISRQTLPSFHVHAFYLPSLSLALEGQGNAYFYVSWQERLCQLSFYTLLFLLI